VRLLPPLSLHDAALYEVQIHRLRTRRARDRWLVPSEQISGALDGHAHEIAVRLARDIPASGYVFSALAPHACTLRGKARILHRVDALDAVVWAAYARALSQAIDARIGDHLYSYRTGRSQFMAAGQCARFFHEHVAARPDPRTRGMFVLRRDVRRYDETIAVSDDSSLWTTLQELSAGTALGDGPVAAQLLKAAFRPAIIQPDGTAAPMLCGMPTGIPTQTIACNVYLLPVDRELVAVEGGFYARFGDDILFAHPDLTQARRASLLLEHGLARLGLALNQEKSVDYWLTGVGRPNEQAPEFLPVRKLPYLGLDVSLDGTRLRTDKRRELLREVRKRVDHAHAAVANCTFDERAQTVARVLQAMFDPSHVLAHRYAAWLRMRAITRADLKHLDHLIALHCAQRLTGQRGVRAFRQASMHKLYSQYGLPSLLQLWDSARRAGRRGP
jgi:hypothetical protein